MIDLNYTPETEMNTMAILALVDACSKSKSFDDLMFSLGSVRLSSFADDEDLVMLSRAFKQGKRCSISDCIVKALNRLTDNLNSKELKIKITNDSPDKFELKSNKLINGDIEIRVLSKEV